MATGEDPWINRLIEELTSLAANDAGLDRRRREGSCSIYRIPPYIRNLRPHLYNYRILPLGLYNKNVRNFTPIIKLQLEVVAVVLKHLTVGWNLFCLQIDAAALDLENFYHDPPIDSFMTSDAINVLVIDAVFIVAKFLRTFSFDPDPPVIVDLLDIFHRGAVQCHLSSFSRDIFWLFENQIPLSLVEGVWTEISVLTYDQNIKFDRALRTNIFYTLESSGLPNPDSGLHIYKGSRISDPKMSFMDCDHLLACLHKAVCMDERTQTRVEPSNRQRRTLPTMSELQRAGIRCRGVKTGISDIRFVKSFLKATLELPKIEFHDSTEKFLLNMCIYEWMNTKIKEKKLLAYMVLMDDLISTVEDVQLLRNGDEPVIVGNYLGEDKMVADLFSNALQGFDGVHSQFVHLDDVKAEILSWYDTPWRHPATLFIEIYKMQPWLLVSIIVAALILTATILQTVYTIKG